MTKIKVRLAIAFFLLLNTSLYAQLNPLSSQYFQNTYLANPAMAGMQKGLRVNLAYRNQWSSMPGSPKNTVVTSDYQENRVGLGLSMLKDQAGLINRTQVLGTYAYHLPLNGSESALHFGLSFGFNSQRLNSMDVVAAANDPSIANFENNIVLDGAFGMAYTKGKFGLELAFDQCNLNHCSFYQLKLKGTPFLNCDMNDVDFTEADLSNSLFHESDLSSAIFEQSNLEKSDFSSAKGFIINPKENKLKQAIFSLEGLPGLLQNIGIQIK